MNKKGGGHVEIILSMVLFVSSVMFIFSFFDLTQETDFNDSNYVFVKGKFTEFASSDVLSFTIILNERSSDAELVTIYLPEEIAIGDTVAVRSYDGDLLKARLTLNDETSERNAVVIERKGNDFFTIIASSGITEPQNEVDVETSVDVASTNTATNDDRIISEVRLFDLLVDYNLNYDELRKELGLGDKTHFAFSIDLSEHIGVEKGFINADRPISARSEVSAQSLRVQVLLSNGDLVFEDLILKTW